MQVKDQIRVRREALGVSPRELADRVGVSPQAVTWWESGRSAPRRKIIPLLEQALSFQLDWSEGRGDKSQHAAAMVDENDMQLLLKICRLPANAKSVFGQMVDIHLEAVDRARRALPPEPRPAPAPPPAPAPAAKRSKVRA